MEPENGINIAQHDWLNPHVQLPMSTIPWHSTLLIEIMKSKGKAIEHIFPLICISPIKSVKSAINI